MSSRGAGCSQFFLTWEASVKIDSMKGKREREGREEFEMQGVQDPAKEVSFL